MKRIKGLICLIALIALTGCGKVNDDWNGVYSNDTDYSILLYTKDDKVASIMVRQMGKNFTFYPVQYENVLSVSSTTLQAVTGEKIVIEKNGTTIKLKLDSEEKGIWTEIEGEYTKYKNIKKFDINQF